jgi:hypothetical protein
VHEFLEVSRKNDPRGSETRALGHSSPFGAVVAERMAGRGREEPGGIDHLAGSARIPGARHELIKADELAATSHDLAHPQVLDPELASSPRLNPFAC